MDGVTGRAKAHSIALPSRHPITIHTGWIALLAVVLAASMAIMPAPASAADPDAPLALDSFDRTGTSGWQTATKGGTYLHGNARNDFFVTGGSGRVVISKPGTSRIARLPNISTRDIDLRFRATANKLPSGGYQRIIGVIRRVAADREYQAQVELRPNGSIWATFVRVRKPNRVQVVAPKKLAGVRNAPGAYLWIRAQAIGKNPTELRLKVWADGNPEPSDWSLSATDTSTQNLKGKGGIAIRTALTKTITNSPTRFLLDDLEALVPSTTPTPPPADPTPTPKPTPTPTPKPSPTPTPTPTSTPAPSSSPTPSSTPSPTPSPTSSPTPSPTPSPDESPPVLPQDAYVVAPNGNNNNPGSVSQPWKTLQYAADRVPSGSTVLIRSGTYVGFKTSRSGTASSPTVFTAYPGDDPPIINSGGTLLDVIKLNGSRYIEISNLIIEGAVGGEFVGAGIRTENGARDITISDNLVRNNRSFGINIHNSSNVIIRDNEVTGNEQGIQIARNGAGVKVLDNLVHHNDKMLRNTPKSVSSGDDAGATGIGFLRTTGPVLAAGNKVWGNRAQSYDYEWDGSAFEIYGASNVTIRDNLVWNNENVLETGTDSGSLCAGNRFIRNLAFGATTQGRSWGMFLRCGQDMLIANNTFHHLDGFVFSIGYGSKKFSGDIEGLRIVNNVAAMQSGKIYGLETELPASVEIDRNLVSNETGQIATVPGQGGTKKLATFTAWTGYEAEGIDADPSFVNATGEDFRLEATSPAVDRGVQISGVTDNYSGSAPDLGAYERP